MCVGRGTSRPDRGGDHAHGLQFGSFAGSVARGKVDCVDGARSNSIVHGRRPGHRPGRRPAGHGWPGLRGQHAGNWHRCGRRRYPQPLRGRKGRESALERRDQSAGAGSPAAARPALEHGGGRHLRPSVRYERTPARLPRTAGRLSRGEPDRGFSRRLGPWCRGRVRRRRQALSDPVPLRCHDPVVQ